MSHLLVDWASTSAAIRQHNGPLELQSADKITPFCSALGPRDVTCRPVGAPRDETHLGNELP